MSFSTDIHNRFSEQAAWTQQAQSLLLQSAGFHPKSKILEVGCGTGAFLSSLNSIKSADYFGIDIQLNLLQYAHDQSYSFPLACADGLILPFNDGVFDAVVCHYFLLWIKDVSGVVAEMKRVTRSGGIIAALAEPDYGSQIEYPSEFELIGKKQRESLIRQGANPDMGRQLAEILSNSGCTNLSTGILGSFQSEPLSPRQVTSEQNILLSDLRGEMEKASLQALLAKDAALRSNNRRVQFIPTFFCWGRNPMN